MFKRKRQEEDRLNGRTPQWFKEWDYKHFQDTEKRSKRNEKLIYLLLAAVVGLNTAGNWYHKEIIDFFCHLFGG
jgi:hypothetical protein